jgi:protoporphyrinogen oxidase
VVFAERRTIEGAYVIYDHHYQAATQQIFPYLEQQGIFSRGRWGSWIYNSMEDSLIQGKEVAEMIDRLQDKDHQHND